MHDRDFNRGLGNVALQTPTTINTIYFVNGEAGPWTMHVVRIQSEPRTCEGPGCLLIFPKLLSYHPVTRMKLKFVHGVCTNTFGYINFLFYIKGSVHTNYAKSIFGLQGSGQSPLQTQNLQ